MLLFLALAGCSGEIGAPGPASSGPDSVPRPSLAEPDLGFFDPPGSDASSAEDAGSASGDLGTDIDLGSPDVGEASDLGLPDTGVEPERVPAWVVQGHVGRTIMSCDDGRTWIHDRAFDAEGDEDMCGVVQDVRCNEGASCQFLDGNTCRSVSSCDCDHSPGAGRGIAYGDGWFVATWGWGPKGGIRVSRDGVSWTKVLDDTTFSGLQFIDGRFVTGSRAPMVAGDPMTWREGGPADLVSRDGSRVWNARKLFRLDLADPLLMLTGESGSAHGIMLSDDAGESWWTPDTMPEGCGSGARGAAAGDGVIVLVGGTDRVCRSTDGGRNFATSTIGWSNRAMAGPVWTGSEFRVWARGWMASSSDGVDWTMTRLDGDGDPGEFAFVGLSPVTGTYVAVNGGWRQWYERQKFYRSEDGVNWQLLDDGDYVGSHWVTHLTFGWVDESADCPAP
jgi:hypothetical protein